MYEMDLENIPETHKRMHYSSSVLLITIRICPLASQRFENFWARKNKGTTWSTRKGYVISLRKRDNIEHNITSRSP